MASPSSNEDITDGDDCKYGVTILRFCPLEP